MLVDKIKADFLTPTKAQLEIELSRVPTEYHLQASTIVVSQYGESETSTSNGSCAKQNQTPHKRTRTLAGVVPGDAQVLDEVAEVDE
jgi:hypothetical protein